MNWKQRLHCFLVFFFFCFVLAGYLTVRAEVLSVDDWKKTSSLPYKLNGQISFSKNGILYVEGGSGDLFGMKSTVLVSTPSANGNISQWEYSNINFPKPLIWSSVANDSINLFVLGGFEEYLNGPVSSVDNVYSGVFDQFSNLISWKEMPKLGKKLSQTASSIYGNKVFLSGGFTRTGSEYLFSSKVYNSTISEYGLGNWSESGDLPSPLLSHFMIGFNDYLYVIGGRLSNFSQTDNVIRTRINDDGTINTWETLTPLPSPAMAFQSTNIGPYIFLVSGNTIFYTKIDNNGLISEWKTSSVLLPKSTCCGSLTAVGDYLYLIGGYDGQPDYTSDVYVTKVNFSESPTPTLAPTPMPTPTEVPLPSPTIIPSPSPTPTPSQEQVPIVVIPGILASFNIPALWDNGTAPNSEWSLCPFCDKYYHGFLVALENAGYTQGKDLFLYNYDWRRNIGKNASDLNGFITNTVFPKNPGVEQVNLVGHSMGGLVARDFAQSNPNKVDQLISVGAPNLGSVKSYKVWEGADFSDYEGKLGALMKLIIQRNRSSYTTDVKMVRNMIPSIQDLLPTFDYIKAGNGQTIVNSQMKYRNDYLPSLNQGLTNQILNRLTTVSGNGFDTAKYLNTKATSQTNKALGYWFDGEPVGAETDLGDETVLISSSEISQAKNKFVNSYSDHSELMNNANVQTAIFKTLNIEANPVIEDFEDNDRLIFVTVASPVSFELVDPEGKTTQPTGGIIIKFDPRPGNYKVKLKGTGNGEYSLYFGRFNGKKSFFEEKFGRTQLGQEISYDFAVDLSNIQMKYLVQAKSRIAYLRQLVNISSTTTLRKRILGAELDLINLGISSLDKLGINQKSRYEVEMQILLKVVDAQVQVWQSSLWKDLPNDLEKSLVSQSRMVNYEIVQDYKFRFRN